MINFQRCSGYPRVTFIPFSGSPTYTSPKIPHLHFPLRKYRYICKYNPAFFSLSGPAIPLWAYFSSDQMTVFLFNGFLFQENCFFFVGHFPLPFKRNSFTFVQCWLSHFRMCHRQSYEIFLRVETHQKESTKEFEVCKVLVLIYLKNGFVQMFRCVFHYIFIAFGFILLHITL